MNNFEAGNLYLPYKDSIPDRVKFVNNLNQNECPTQSYLNNVKISDDINVHLLNMGLKTGNCGSNDTYNKICPIGAYCTKNNQCQKIKNYKDLSDSNNIFRECLSKKDVNCIIGFTDNKGWAN